MTGYSFMTGCYSFQRVQFSASDTDVCMHIGAMRVSSPGYTGGLCYTLIITQCHYVCV